MKVLCHVDPWCKDQFATISGGFEPTADIVFVSGSWTLDETGFARNYYRYVDGLGDLADWVNAADSEVIARCRLLRSLEIQDAHKHVRAMRRSAREMLEAYRPDIFLCESTDQYVHDILFQEAHALGIRSYGLIQSFVNGYFRISERGEMNLVRTPSMDEVEEVRNKLSGDNYVPKFISKAKKSPRATYFRIMLSNLARILYFGARRILINEKYNYHAWASERTTRQLYAHILPKINLGTSSWRERISAIKKPVIYVPLQHFPEATIDYWTEDIYFVDYPRRLLELVNILRPHFHVLLKEHPGVWGYRKPSFYRQFQNLSDVTICPTNEPSQDCISACDAVLVWTGSVGFEAALRGKAVLTVCTPYYMDGRRYLHIDLDTDSGQIREFIQWCKTTPIELQEQQSLVAHLLSGLIAGRFQNDGTYDPASEEDVSDARKIGVMLRTVYDTGTRH